MPGSTPLGAYGLRWPSIASVAEFLQPVEAGDPEIRSLHFEACEPGVPKGFGFGPERSFVGFGDDGRISMERAAASVTYAVREVVTEQGLVHPYLAFPAAVFNRWAGRNSFHAGAIVLGGRAFVVAGHKEAGKSTTLAGLAAEGVPVLSDDLVILDKLRVLPGPRCIDLRQEAAEHLGDGEPLGVVGARERWRIKVAPAAPELLGGFVYLGWGDREELTPLPLGERLQRLFQYDALEVGPTDPATFMDLARLPAWDFRRPNGIESMSRSLNRLLDVLAP